MRENIEHYERKRFGDMENERVEFGYPKYSALGEQVLTDRFGEYKNMLMDISVLRMKKDERRILESGGDETAVLLIKGEVTFEYAAQTRAAKRGDCIRDGGYCLHVCRGTSVTLSADGDCELLVQKTGNDRDFPPVFYRPQDCRDEISGKGLYGDTAVRLVRTMFDYDNAPYSNMVLGEVISSPGGWSGYIPHSHDQPEVYYYRFDRPQGFGACFIGDNVYKIKDGSFCAIPGGVTHPQATAPGYRMYYVWMIHHLPGNPWTDRVLDPDHVWLLDAKDKT